MWGVGWFQLNPYSLYCCIPSAYPYVVLPLTGKGLSHPKQSQQVYNSYWPQSLSNLCPTNITTQQTDDNTCADESHSVLLSGTCESAEAVSTT